MPDSTFPRTAGGWPYLDDNNFVHMIDDYSKDLADKLASTSRMSAGSVPISITSAAGGTVSVTFPAGRFTAAPIVQVSRATSALAKYIPYVASVTASGCVLGLYSGDGTTATGATNLAWFAYQRP